MIPQNIPMINPVVTSHNECCLTIMRALPIIPANIISKHNHQIGLKRKMKL